jgi:hypothetical protein
LHDLRPCPLDQTLPPLRGDATWQEWLHAARGRAEVTGQGNPSCQVVLIFPQREGLL